MLKEEELTEQDRQLIEDLKKPTPYQSAIMTIERTIKDVSGTSITSSNAIVDVLLDIMNDVQHMQSFTSTIARIMQNNRRRLDYYEDTFGKVDDVPDGWMPSWAYDFDGLDEEEQSV